MDWQCVRRTKASSTIEKEKPFWQRFHIVLHPCFWVINVGNSSLFTSLTNVPALEVLPNFPTWSSMLCCNSESKLNCFLSTFFSNASPRCYNKCHGSVLMYWMGHSQTSLLPVPPCMAAYLACLYVMSVEHGMALSSTMTVLICAYHFNMCPRTPHTRGNCKCV